MRRCALGVWLLSLLLGLGILSTLLVRHRLEPVTQALEQAGQLALAQNWEEADLLARQAQAQWEAGWTLTAALSNHTPMETADQWFARLAVYREGKDPVAYAAACAQLAGLLEAIAEGQIPSLRNLL